MADSNDPKKDMLFLKLFEEGKNFTEELLRENERLRLQVAKLRSNMKDVESQYIKVDVPQMKEKIHLQEVEIGQLRQDNEELKDQFVSVEEENREFAERYVEVERQNSSLISMYVASYRLHSTLDYDEVLNIVKEIVINMIGSEKFGIYLLDEEEKELFLIANEGMDGREGERVALGAGPVGKTAESGELYVAAPEVVQDGSAEVLACIPLKVKDRRMGVIAIEKLLIQKDGFEALDMEMFELLGKHAATAIYGASAFTVSERKRSTLEGFVGLLRMDTAG